MRTKQLLLSLLAFAVILSACGTNETPDVKDPDPDPTSIYTLAAAIGPATVVAHDGSTSTGLASQVYVFAPEAADQDTTFQITILDENGEPIGDATEIRQWKGTKMATLNVDRLDHPYEPGRYTVVASLAGEEVARQEYVLTQTSGLPAPERITAEASLEHIRVDFGPVDASSILAGIFEKNAHRSLLKFVPGDAESAIFDYDESFALSRDKEYVISLHADESRVTGTESVLSRFLVVNRLEVELEEIVETFVSTAISSDVDGNEGILLLASFTQPLGAPDADGPANFNYKVGADDLEGTPRGVWEAGDRTIHASPHFVSLTGIGLSAAEALADEPITVTATLGEAEYTATLDMRPLPSPLATAPANLVLAATEDGLELEWDGVTGATNYVVVVMDQSDFSNWAIVYPTEPSFFLPNSDTFTANPSAPYSAMVFALDGDPRTLETRFLSGSHLIYYEGASD